MGSEPALTSGPGPLGGVLLVAATVAAGLYAGAAGVTTAFAAGLAAATSWAGPLATPRRHETLTKAVTPTDVGAPRTEYRVR